MTRTIEISNYDDVIDSRDVIERIEYLTEEIESDGVHADREAHEELTALKKLAEQGEDSSDWSFGEQLIRDGYFEQYAQELADDLGLTDKQTSWPYTCIVWELAARDLQMDYSSVDYNGVTYWIRS